MWTCPIGAMMRPPGRILAAPGLRIAGRVPAGAAYCPAYSGRHSRIAARRKLYYGGKPLGFVLGTVRNGPVEFTRSPIWVEPEMCRFVPCLRRIYTIARNLL